MSFLPMPTRRRYMAGLGQADLVGGLVGGAVGIYTQSVQMKHDARMAKKALQSEMILAGEQAKTQEAADAAAQDRTAMLVKAAKGIGAGFGLLALLYIVLGGGRKRAAPTAPIIITRAAPPPPVVAPVVPVKANRRRYARALW